MKNLTFFIAAMLLGATVFAQAPQSFRYQAVARDNSGSVLASQNVSFRISILSGSVSGTVNYRETHTSISTNAFGLVELEIGKGTPVNGTFSSIDWGGNSYFVKIEMDPSGGSTYQLLSTSQLLSVPYALYSQKAGNGFSGNYNDLTNKPLLFDGTWLSLTEKPAFATVATSGSYTDLLNKPALFNGTWNSLAGKPVTLVGYGITDAMGTSHVANGITSSMMTNWNTAYGWGNHTGLYRTVSWVPSWTDVTGKPNTFLPTAHDHDNITNATGLEKITEGTNTGWRLIGQNPENYGNIGNNTVDLSVSTAASETRGATGAGSTAMGYLTTASGNGATAMGYQTKASGITAVAMGVGTKAEAQNSTAIGTSNIGGGSPTSWVETDPLFEIGNGTFSTPNNALTVLKNGTITAPSLTNSLITTAGAKALITKEYADANLKSSGLEKITEGTNTGWRLIGQNPANYGNIGTNAVDLSVSSQNSPTRGATGLNSTAIGNATIASGGVSTAIGYWSTASGSKSTAMGDETLASGTVSTAIGSLSQASGNYTLATGRATKAEAYYSTAIGTYNIGGGSPASWVATDPLFEIGNGTSARNNALTVYKNGNTDVDGVLRAQNNIWPGKGAGVEIAYNNSLGIGYVQTYDRNTAIWKDLAFGALNVRPVSDNFTSLGTSTIRWSKVYSANGSIQTSDSRMKKEINDIPYGLNSILKLRPVTFKWKEGNQNVNLGLIAQDVQNLIPEVVDIGNDKDKTLGLNYSNLIPVLIKAIQEQQELIQQLKTEVELLKK